MFLSKSEFGKIGFTSVYTKHLGNGEGLKSQPKGTGTVLSLVFALDV